MIDAQAVRKMVKTLRGSFKIPLNPPPYIEIALQHLREDYPAPAEFLEQTKELPGGTVVRVSNGVFSILTDSEGNILSFR